MKKFFKRLLYGEKGAVSVFAILIIVPIFLLNALFIDTIRIITAERQIENAMDTALRSTMAEFNEKLAAKGLFGYSGSQAEAESDFQNYLDAQFYTADDAGDMFTMVQPNIQSGSATASFDTDRNLVDLEVFEHQILESMKYQAPAQIGQEIFSFVRNSGLDSVDEEGADSVEELIESYQELFELAKLRNAKIDAARTHIDKYIAMVSPDGDLINIIGPADPNLPEEIPTNISNMEELIFYNERYHELKEEEEAAEEDDGGDNEGEEDSEEDEEERENRQQEIENYEDALNQLSSDHLSIFNIFTGIRSDINRELFGTGPAAGSPDNYGPYSAMYYNDEMAEIMDGINFDNIEVDDEAREEIEKLENMVLDDEFFIDIYNHVEILDEQFEPGQTLSLEEALAGGYTSRTVVELVDGFHKTIEDHVDAATNIKDELRQRYINYRDNDAATMQNHLDVYEDSKELLEQEDGLEEMEEEADNSFDELWDIIGGLEDLANDQEVYDELAGYIAEYDAVNGDIDTENPGRLDFIKDAFERFGHFIEFIAGFPESFRNQLYVNEYIMANYGTSESYSLNPASGSFLYENKQAQFITYGYNTAGANYLAFIRDIAMLIFVVNLVDLILFRGGFAGPLGVLRAIVLALGDTAVAITTLTSTNEYKWRPLQISPQFDMTMPIFMRFFMIIRSLGGEDYNNDKMRRIQAAITEDTGVRLDDNPSYIKGTVTGEVDLLFIPALTHLIPNEDGSLSGNTYSIEKTKVYSY